MSFEGNRVTLPVSAREREVLQLASIGMTDKQIAQQLQIGLGTVATYWNRIRGKLEVNTRSEMVARFVESRASKLIIESEDENAELRAEIERRIEAENALRETNMQMQAILGSIPDLVVLLDREGVTLMIHAGDEFEFAVEPSEFVGKRLEEFMPAREAEATYKALNAAFATGATQTLETIMPMEKGTRYYESRLTPCGRDYVVSIVRDVTNWRVVNEALRASESRLRLAAGVAKIGVWEVNLDTMRFYLSPEWKANYGFTESDGVDDQDFWRARVHPDDLEALAESVKRCAEGGATHHQIRYRMRHKQGHYVWMESVAVVDEAHGHRRLVGYTVDISHLAEAFGVNLKASPQS